MPSIDNEGDAVDEEVSKISFSKRALPVNTAPFYVPNQPLPLLYLQMYPFAVSRQNYFHEYFQNEITKPAEEKLNINVVNRIINKNESKSPSLYYYIAPPRNKTTEITSTNKKSSKKDTLIFEEKEYELNDPFAEQVKKNFENYLFDLRKKGSAMKFNTSFIDERISNFKNTTGIKSLKYCQEYEKYLINGTQNAKRVLPLSIDGKNECIRIMPLIVGGDKAYFGEFPHMAGLGFDRGQFIEFLCGGSLISPRFVLTAGHCAKTKWGSPVMVRLGITNLIHDGGKNMNIENIIVHPGYKPPACYNDIALIKIVEGLQLGPNLRPACLPQPNTDASEPKHLVVATGWGRVGYGQFSSPNLQKVTLQVIGREDCEKSFTKDDLSKRLTSGIVDNMICASGYLKPSHDTCQGDSGGPLQVLLPNNSCMHQIVGITSFGKLCGTGLPGVYTKVSAFLPWIEDIVWPS